MVIGEHIRQDAFPDLLALGRLVDDGEGTEGTDALPGRIQTSTAL